MVENPRDKPDPQSVDRFNELAAASEKLYHLYSENKETTPDSIASEAVDQATERASEAIFAASQWQLMWRKFRRNRAAMVGLFMIIFIYMVAAFGDFIAPYTLTTRFRRYIYMQPQVVHFFYQGRFLLHVYEVDLKIDENLKKVYTPLPEKPVPIKFFIKGEPYKLLGLIQNDVHLFGVEGDNIVALLGTDRQGRDMFSRLILGSQISLTIGLIGTFLSLAIGAVLGLISGYYGGIADELIQRTIELVRSFPSVPLWMALSAALPQEWNEIQTYFAVTLILSLIGWTWLARQLRGSVLSIRNEDYVTAARLAGASDGWIISRHLLPATFGHMIVVATLAVPSMILAETALSFLGLGLRPPITSWGVLIQEAQNFQSVALYPWILTPAVAIAITVLAFSYLGDGLRDAVDPYTR